MMPPKKSKAARALDDLPGEEGSANGEVEDEKPVNIFKVEILTSKRERTVPVYETIFNTWINDNFEDKEGVRLNMGDVYEHYLDMCSMKGCNVVDEQYFYRVLKENFPGGFTVKESSVLHGEIKEKKIVKKKEKVEGETMKLKMKDIVHQQLEELGNPKTGVRFNTLLKHIGARYPALRLDLNSSPLLRCLNTGVYYGHLYVVKGVGKCGYYRIWKEGMDDEDEEEEEKGAKKEKTDEEGGAEGGEGSAEDDEKDSAEEGGDKPAEDGKKEKRKAKKQKGKGAKKKTKPKPQRSVIVHSAPQRVRDCFPLAITYMSEPKIASVRRIKQYLEDYYDFTNDNRLKKTLEEGIEKGWWSLVSGNVGGGSFELLVDEFDPTDDDDAWGKIVNALTACAEPKECSANLLKKYVVEYHPQFKVSEKPFLFKRAVESAVNAGELKQLSGLGCTGTFQLVQQFIPGPHILAGKDTESDYEEVTSSEESDFDEDAEGGVDIAYFQTDNYVPRPSKRRGKGRKVGPIEKLTYVPTEPSRKRRLAAQKAKRGRPAKKGGRGGKRKKYEEDSSSEEEEEDSSEEEEEEDSSEEEDSEASEDEYSKQEKYKPRPSKSRGGGGGGRGRGRSPPPPPARKKPAAKGRGRGRPPKAAAAEPEETAPAKSGRGRGRPPKGKAAAAPAAKGKAKGGKRRR